MADDDRPKGPVATMALRNLRRFEDTEQIRLTAFNFVFGKNSSGKTTILRAPLLFRQLVEARPTPSGLPLSGQYADFGSYEEAVYNGEKSRDIELSFGITLRDSAIPSGLFDTVSESFDEVEVRVRLHWNKVRGQCQMNTLKFLTPDGSPLTLLTRLSPDKVRLEVPVFNFSQVLTGVAELSFQSIALFNFRKSLDEVARRRQIDLFAYFLYDMIRETVSRIVHVGPLRDMPERAYRTDQLASAGRPSSRMLSLLMGGRQTARVVAEAVRDLGIAQSVEVANPAPGYAGIHVVDPATGRRDNLADVGFGVSQVLPIIAEIVTAPRNSLVLIEQPELHLHPETQGELASVMIRLAQRTSTSLLIESHSENILLRIRRAVATGDIDPRDVSIFVTDQGQVRQATVRRDGSVDMDAFPPDFFDEDWIDMMEITRAAGKLASKK